MLKINLQSVQWDTMRICEINYLNKKRERRSRPVIAVLPFDINCYSINLLFL